MTTEGRPYLGPDDTYEKQRRCRMSDAISDYLDDEEVDARRCYEEMLAEVNEIIDYHKCKLEKARKLKNLMLGHRQDLDFIDDMLDDSQLSDKWQFAKHKFLQE